MTKLDAMDWSLICAGLAIISSSFGTCGKSKNKEPTSEQKLETNLKQAKQDSSKAAISLDEARKEIAKADSIKKAVEKARVEKELNSARQREDLLENVLYRLQKAQRPVQQKPFNKAAIKR